MSGCWMGHSHGRYVVLTLHEEGLSLLKEAFERMLDGGMVLQGTHLITPAHRLVRKIADRERV